MAANQAQVMADAARQQMVEQAQKTDYVSGVDMTAGGQLAARNVGERAPSTPVCVKCKADVGAGKFCPQCGTPAAAAAAKQFCPQCGTAAERSARFCPECGGKLAGGK
jgi:RNA polymerase subunit RPABC4/transcription elongation factor Spt4